MRGYKDALMELHFRNVDFVHVESVCTTNDYPHIKIIIRSNNSQEVVFLGPFRRFKEDHLSAKKSKTL